jgi:catechol 2,3-dioxygenase-like lactoylglutathione lyase family enzyme
MIVRRVLETCIYAVDLDAAEKFYRDVLGLTFYSKAAGRHVFFRCGESMFLIFNPEQTSKEAHPHGALGRGHVAFEMELSELGAWRAQLAAHGVKIEVDHTWPNGARSFYFADPAGNNIELATKNLWGI